VSESFPSLLQVNVSFSFEFLLDEQIDNSMWVGLGCKPKDDTFVSPGVVLHFLELLERSSS
jgi:hypothetical protein